MLDLKGMRKFCEYTQYIQENDLRPIHSAEDVKNVIEKETNMTYEIKVHTAAEIKAVRESLPNLGPLSKAMKIHEIHISSCGDVRSKFLPSDVFYENVKIKESRRHRRVETDLESDLDE